jgi:hypothetical protein
MATINGSREGTRAVAEDRMNRITPGHPSFDAEEATWVCAIVAKSLGKEPVTLEDVKAYTDEYGWDEFPI